ncbi:MAG: cbb3-type cytochrome c oxidase subunit 3 [Pseudomonadota bacterium]
MDIGMFRGLVTAVLLGLFVWLVVWAFGKSRRQAFDAAARLPLEDEEQSGS